MDSRANAELLSGLHQFLDRHVVDVESEVARARCMVETKLLSLIHI